MPTSASPGRSSSEYYPDLTCGAIDGMVVYDCDRLARRPIDRERLIDRYENAR